MKNKVIFLFAIFLIFLPLLVPFSAFAEEKSYVLSYSPGTLFHQLVRDRIKIAYEEAGIPVEFVTLPHNRSLLSANEGSVDGDVGRVAAAEEQYPNLRRVNAKLIDLNGAVYTTNPDINTYDESLLDKYRIGYVLGVRWAQKKMEGRQAITVATYPALFEMLLSGRIDIALATEASADAAMAELSAGAEKIRKLQPFVFSAPIYHFLHKKNAALIPRLEQAIRDMNQEGIFVFYTGVESPLFEILQKRLQEAFRRIGKVCEVRTTGSAQRALSLANEKGDGDAVREANLKRNSPDVTANLVQIPEPIADFAYHTYAATDLPLTGWESLAGKQNGLREGEDILEQSIPGEQVRLPDAESLLQMLAEQRIDTVTEASDVADFIIRKNGYQIIKLAPLLVASSGYSYLHKKHETLLPALAASLAEMKADGSFERIRRETIEQLLAE